MRVADFIKRMVAAGASAEVIAIAVEAIEERSAQIELSREQARERKRKQRERDSHVTVTGQSRDHDGMVTDKTLSLPLSPQTPQSPTHTHGDITTHTREAPQVVAIDGELLDRDEPEKPVVRDKRGTRLPDDWTPSPAEIRFAAQQNMTLEETSRVAENFRDYWIAKPGAAGRKLDWSATWRNWVRSHVQRGRPSGPSGPSVRMASRPAYGAGGGQGATDFAAIVARNRGYTPT